MQITHEEARNLIQFDADKALHPQDHAALSAHLNDCGECRAYAQDIKEVESILLPMMKKQWNFQPIPLSIPALRVKRNSGIQANLLTTRKAMISVILAAFLFGLWQFTSPGRPASGQLPIGTLPVPIPSTQTTSTENTIQNCNWIRYIVRDDDTLASIAYQFSITEEEIMTVNNMTTERVIARMELILPVCDFTPTGTVDPISLTTTHTPALSPTTITPDG